MLLVLGVNTFVQIVEFGCYNWVDYRVLLIFCGCNVGGGTGDISQTCDGETNLKIDGSPDQSPGEFYD